MNKLSGIYLVERKWDLVYLKNNQFHYEEYMNYFKFENLLLQVFNSDQIKKILDQLNSEHKLIIDFDKAVVKLIKEKEVDYLQSFASYFTPKAAEEWLNNNLELEENLYKGD